MAYLYRKNRSPYWYVQYLDSDRRKHDRSTGLRADDPNDTAKAKALRAELEASEHRRAPTLNGSGWDWVPKFFARHCQTDRTLRRYEDGWKWISLWLQRSRTFQPSRRWQQFFIKIGKTHLCFHCLRVTYVNRLRRAGVPREAAMRLVNHSSELIHKIYQRERVEDIINGGMRYSLEPNPLRARGPQIETRSHSRHAARWRLFHLDQRRLCRLRIGGSQMTNVHL